MDLDLFANLDNWKSLAYFCSLGGIRYVINEWFKNIFLMSPAISGPDSPMPFSSNSNAGTSFTMSNPRSEVSTSRGEGEGSLARTNASEIEAATPKSSKASSSKIKNLFLWTIP